MTKSGTYTITLEYFTAGNADTETTEVSFEYDAEAPPATDDSVAVAGGGGDGSTTLAGAGPTTTFQNITEGFRVQVPNGWVAADNDVADSVTQEFIAREGYAYVGVICAQDQALPKIGGLYECTGQSGTDDVGITLIKFVNLHTRPEFANILSQNQNITIDDILALDIEHRKSLVSPEAAARLQIESQTDTTVNVIDPVTNQTVRTVPAKIKYSITAPQGTVFALYSLVVLTDNGNTGYSVEPYSGNPIESAEEMPAYFRQVFDSFELLAPPQHP